MNACRSCEHWRTVGGLDRQEAASGKCARILEYVGVSGGIAQPGTLMTTAGFGCVLHSHPFPVGEAHARRGDPEESKAAARSITNLSARRRDVLRVLAGATAPLSDRELVERYNVYLADVPCLVERQGPSGIRSRRAELVSMGLVTRTGSTQIGGRMHATWWPTDAGREALR